MTQKTNKPDDKPKEKVEETKPNKKDKFIPAPHPLEGTGKPVPIDWWS